MSWWLVGTGADLNVGLDHKGVWSLNGRPTTRESQYDILHDQASPADMARLRDARASWHLRSELGSLALDGPFEALVRARRAASPEMTLGVAVFGPRSHGGDTLEFNLLPPPSAFETLREMFTRIIGRSDLSYRIASALIKDREVLAEDWPSTHEIFEGRPHFTAGVEFSIYSNSTGRG